MNILTVDVGSTYTKLTAIDGDQRRILGTSQAFTTIETDVMQGFQEAFERLTENREGNLCAGFKYVWLRLNCNRLPLVVPDIIMVVVELV